MARRSEQRLRTVLPVRVFGTDSAGKPFTDLAHTLDISGLGARLGGIQHALTAGDIVGVQRGVHKARFRVAWVGQRGTRSSGQIGVLCMEPTKNIWSVDFAGQQVEDAYTPPSIPLDDPDFTVKASPPRREERRLTRRIPCNIGVEMRAEGSDVSLYARCTDLSTGGCYIETRAPLPRATRLRIVLHPESPAIVAGAIVRTSDISFGMGLQFIDLRTEDATRLGTLLAKLSGEAFATEPRIERTPEFRDNMVRMTRELCQLEKRFTTSRIDSDTLGEFRAALDKVRHASWAVQQFKEAHPGSEDSTRMAKAMTQQRMKIATTLSRELCVDLSAQTPDDADALSELFQAVGCLFQRLGHALARQQARGAALPSQPSAAEILRLAPTASQRPS